MSPWLIVTVALPASLRATAWLERMVLRELLAAVLMATTMAVIIARAAWGRLHSRPPSTS